MQLRFQHALQKCSQEVCVKTSLQPTAATKPALWSRRCQAGLAAALMQMRMTAAV